MQRPDVPPQGQLGRAIDFHQFSLPTTEPSHRAIWCQTPLIELGGEFSSSLTKRTGHSMHIGTVLPQHLRRLGFQALRRIAFHRVDRPHRTAIDRIKRQPFPRSGARSGREPQVSIRKQHQSPVPDLSASLVADFLLTVSHPRNFVEAVPPLLNCVVACTIGKTVIPFDAPHGLLTSVF